jgi:hypothetical protein
MDILPCMPLMAVIKQGRGAAGDTGDVANSLLFLHPLKSNLENSISLTTITTTPTHTPPYNPDPAVMRAFFLLGLAAAATAMPEITSDGNTVSLMAPDGDVMVRVAQQSAQHACMDCLVCPLRWLDAAGQTTPCPPALGSRR